MAEKDKEALGLISGPKLGDSNIMWAIFRTPSSGPVDIKHGDALGLHRTEPMVVTNDAGSQGSFPDRQTRSVLWGMAAEDCTVNGALIKVITHGFCTFRYIKLPREPRVGEWVDRCDTEEPRYRGFVERRIRPGDRSGARVLMVNQQKGTVLVYM